MSQLRFELGTCKSSQEHYHLVFAYIVIIHQDEAFVPPRPYELQTAWSIYMKPFMHHSKGNCSMFVWSFSGSMVAMQSFEVGVTLLSVDVGLW